jgi:hypothetical protein
VTQPFRSDLHVAVEAARIEREAEALAAKRLRRANVSKVTLVVVTAVVGLTAALIVVFALLVVCICVQFWSSFR